MRRLGSEGSTHVSRHNLIHFASLLTSEEWCKVKIISLLLLLCITDDILCTIGPLGTGDTKYDISDVK